MRRFPVTVRSALATTVVAGGLWLLGGNVSKAQLNFTLANSSPHVPVGTTFQFFATLTNTDPNNSISLDSDSFTYTDPNAASNFTDNFANTPLTLNPSGQSGDSWTGDLFDVTVPANYVPGTVYTGSYTINFTDNGVSSSVTQNFSVTVASNASTPELSSLLGLGLLVTGGVWSYRRHRRYEVVED
ncbi:hypothetical protein CTKA_00091 [Chthonomonas calidirosea]|uniref:Uncharacterized protein n=1 Tax=Chthonomonas calidirosea (strain DSM 23976 / ICMP 18418 / T49) TaxID=1303518 RepID=S0ETN4_CHTCT|nr:hypothetical protein [Chthonomonas calidirosea]CCW34890.1 hypothetical protein CCALI_01068 [Chthonomonas calidirosea T49]CEK13500.1 hypothetical protein CTKA_00091 [Chthonomonas calidirosea]